MMLKLGEGEAENTTERDQFDKIPFYEKKNIEWQHK